MASALVHSTLVVQGNCTVPMRASGVCQRCLSRPSRWARHAATKSVSRLSVSSRAAMRYMILMRHAESEADQPSVRDHDRNISAGGIEASKRVAGHLRDIGWLPDLLLCSNSKRTKQTVEAMADVVTVFSDVDVHFLGTLYTIAALDGMTKSHLSMRVREYARDDMNCTVMCVGHNRGWEEAASAFTGQKVQLETANAALLEIHADTWEEATSEESLWHLVGVVTADGLVTPDQLREQMREEVKQE